MKVCLASPILGQPAYEHAECVAAAMATFVRDDISFHRIVVHGESLIHRARNAITHRFLETDCTHLLMVDADITFAPADILTLVRSELDVIGGVCPKKTLGYQPVLTPLEGGEVRSDGIVEVAEIGTGFLCISRDALERIQAAFVGDEYVAEPGDAGHEGELVHAFFQAPLVGRRLLSEDYFFCDRWRSMGGRVWAHAGVRPCHVGSFTFGRS